MADIGNHTDHSPPAVLTDELPYDSAGKPAPGVAEAENRREAVLRRYPDHPGANHFYVHAVESSPTPERAIPSAQRLMGLMPSAGHMVHMPGHIWFLLGDYETAASVNERAAALDRQYAQDTGVTGSAYFGSYIHNLHFIAVARSMQGRMRQSLDAADQIAAAIRPMQEAMPEMVDIFDATPNLMRVRFQRWDEVLAAPAPGPKMVAASAIAHYARAIALEAKGRHAEAVQEQALFETARAQVPAAALWLNNKTADVLAIAAEVLAARLAAAADSVPHWQRAVALQDALVYDEPPGWYYPVRESLGAALLRAGKPGEAEIVLREGLRRSPRDGRMLFALVESLKAQQKAAEWVSQELATAWQRADVPIRIADL